MGTALERLFKARKLPDKPATPSMEIGVVAGTTKKAQMKRDDEKRRLVNSREFRDYAFNLAEGAGVVFTDEQAAVRFVSMLADKALDEQMIGMAPLGTIKMQSQVRGADKKFPGLKTPSEDGQHAGPTSDTRSADEEAAETDPVDDILQRESDPLQTPGPDSYPGLSYIRQDGQRVGPRARTRSAEGKHPVKAESIRSRIYNSLAGNRVRESVNMGRNPAMKEIMELAESEGFTFDTPTDVENFMKVALHEKLYPSVGPTHHANQMTGDGFPALSDQGMDIRGLKKAPTDGTLGQNKTGARDPKNKGEAPHNNYKDDGPKGKTQQFEQDPSKICPVCQKGNKATNAYCGACGTVLPPRPEDKDGGVPAKGVSYGGKRNWNVETDGGTPNTRSPYGGSKSKNYYLKPSPPAMKESITESSRVVISNLLRGPLQEADLDYSPTGVHDMRLTSPALGSVNAKAQGLGVNPIEQGELDRVVGLFQQGERVKKVSMYTGVDARLVQSVANMMGIGDTHGETLGQVRFTAPYSL